MTTQELMLISAIRKWKVDKDHVTMLLRLLDVLEAPIAAEEGGTPPPLWPVHVTSEIEPLQDTDQALQ